MASLAGISLTMSTFPCSLKRSQVPKTCSLNSISLPSKELKLHSVRMRSVPARLRVSCMAKKETVDKVCEIVKKQLALPDDSSVTAESKFVSLGADSLDTVEIVMGLEEEFGVSVEEETAQNIVTVRDAADLIEILREKGNA